MGGVAAFQIGSKGVEDQVAICALILIFSLFLLTGSFYGAEVRRQNNMSIGDDIEVEKNRHILDECPVPLQQGRTGG